jgi:hypothetical protein
LHYRRCVTLMRGPRVRKPGQCGNCRCNLQRSMPSLCSRARGFRRQAVSATAGACVLARSWPSGVEPGKPVIYDAIPPAGSARRGAIFTPRAAKNFFLGLG